MKKKKDAGLFSDDITFCPEECARRSCVRNKKNIRDKSVPHSFFMEIPDDCPKAANNKPDIEYTIRMNSEQAREMLRAVELFMRLKLGQYYELPYLLIPLNRKDFCERRDEANLRLKEAFRWMQGYLGPTEYKDREWHVLYNILQAVRYQVHNAEHPDTIGVDSTPPVDIGETGIPECTYEVKSK